MINKGYTLVAQNHRYSGGEIDLVMKKRGEVAFIEVKTHILNQLSNYVICETINDNALKINRCKIRRMRIGSEDYFVKHETSDRGKAAFRWLEVFLGRVSYETAAIRLCEVLIMKRKASLEPRKVLQGLGLTEKDYRVEEVNLCLICPL